ncbi:MAG: hypothetical protein JXR73_15245, partial [Candidatus Omnitrophica bacterium]|nr:hypothetical protein [Candidatus Omnitrophota bacterium]
MIKKTNWLAVFALLTASFALAGDNPASWNVKDYGALGDGVVDDGPAIGRTLDAAANAGGGEVFLPAGKYRIADSLSVPSGVTLCGV